MVIGLTQYLYHTVLCVATVYIVTVCNTVWTVFTYPINSTIVSVVLGFLFCYSIPPFLSTIPLEHSIPLIPDACY